MSNRQRVYNLAGLLRCSGFSLLAGEVERIAEHNGSESISDLLRLLRSEAYSDYGKPTVSMCEDNTLPFTGAVKNADGDWTGGDTAGWRTP